MKIKKKHIAIFMVVLILVCAFTAVTAYAAGSGDVA